MSGINTIKLKQAIQSSGVSVTLIAQRAGVTRSYLYKLMAGNIDDTGATKLQAIGRQIGLSVDELLSKEVVGDVVPAGGGE